jgi:hypothetical protein
MIAKRFAFSEPQACPGSPVSTARRSATKARRDGDRYDALRERLRRLSASIARFGYLLAWGAVREEGCSVNRKKIQCLAREGPARAATDAQAAPARRLGRVLKQLVRDDPLQPCVRAGWPTMARFVGRRESGGNFQGGAVQ